MRPVRAGFRASQPGVETRGCGFPGSIGLQLVRASFRHATMDSDIADAGRGAAEAARYAARLSTGKRIAERIAERPERPDRPDRGLAVRDAVEGTPPTTRRESRP